jgi:hypothetical protein
MNNPVLDRIRAQAAIRMHQLLVNIKENRALAKENLGNKVLVQKANQALQALAPPEAFLEGFKAASVLRNGRGILLEAKSAEIIDWIKKDNRKANLANRLEDGATVQDRTYVVVVPFVPLNLRPELEVDRTRWRRTIY